jgi:hypothetical protein
LLVPPDGLAALELRLRPFRRRLASSPSFCVRRAPSSARGRFAGLDLVGAEVDVCIEHGLALVDLGFPVVALADSVADRKA